MKEFAPEFISLEGRLDRPFYDNELGVVGNHALKSYRQGRAYPMSNKFQVLVYGGACISRPKTLEFVYNVLGVKPSLRTNHYRWPTFGQALLQVTDERGVSSRQLADAVGVSRANAANWFKRPVRWETLKDITEALNAISPNAGTDLLVRWLGGRPHEYRLHWHRSETRDDACIAVSGEHVIEIYRSIANSLWYWVISGQTSGAEETEHAAKVVAEMKLAKGGLVMEWIFTEQGNQIAIADEFVLVVAEAEGRWYWWVFSLKTNACVNSGHAITEVVARLSAEAACDGF